jgi:signal transduction histidine kinase
VHFANIAHVDQETLRKLRHDLRSPLVVVAGFAQLLGTDKPVSDQERRDYSERILAASREMEALIDEALTP